MFGNNQYWWAGLLMFILFVGLNLLVWALRNKPKLSYAIAWSIAAFFFVYKCAEYTYHQCVGDTMDFPVEFSALSYFVFAILIVFGNRKCDQFGAFTAILAGAIYSLSWWVAPDSHIGGHPYFGTMAIINHHLLYLGGMLITANCRKFDIKHSWQIALGVGVFVGYSWLIYKTTDYAAVMGKPIIINITDGGIVQTMLGADPSNVGVKIGYYIFAITLFVLMAAGFFLLSHWQSKRRRKKGLPEDYFASGLDIYRI